MHDTEAMIMTSGRDKSALMLVDPSTKASTIVAESGKSDIGYVISSPTTREALAYGSEFERMKWTALKPELEADIKFLDKQVTGYWSVLSQSKDNNLWTLWMDNTGDPIKFGLYDRKKRALKTLFAARPGCGQARL